MDFDRLLINSFLYTKDAFLGKQSRWILFIISKYLLYPIFLGYMVEIYRGKMPSRTDNPYEFIDDEPVFGALFFNGLKLFVIKLIYTVPIAIIAAPLLITLIFGDEDALSGLVSGTGIVPEEVLFAFGFLTGLAIVIYTFLIGINLPIALVRFSRTGLMREAFRFFEIQKIIGHIGRLNYIIALFLLAIIIGLIEYLLLQVPEIGWALLIIFTPVLAVFSARYITMIYETLPE
ncbi:DUF4013 domain-containing protein [Methanocalculus sp. MC3]